MDKKSLECPNCGHGRGEMSVDWGEGSYEKIGQEERKCSECGHEATLVTWIVASAVAKEKGAVAQMECLYREAHVLRGDAAPSGIGLFGHGGRLVN